MMKGITLHDLPHAVEEIYVKLENVENLLVEMKNTRQTNNDELLSIEHAAEILSLSVQTIYGLTSRNEIPVHKRGKRLYF